MGRKPKEARNNEMVKRSVNIPGNLYNRFAQVAEKEHRDVNSQIITIMEMYLKEKESQAA